MQKSGNRNSDGRDGNVNVNISGGKGKYGRLTKTSPRPPPPTTTSPNNRSLGKINITNKKAKKTKVVPKSKHHTIAKPTKRKYSINNRVAAVKANKSAAAAATGKSASAKPKPKKKNASSSWNESGGGKRRSTNGIGMAISSSGPIRKSNNNNTSRSSSNNNNNFRSTVGTNYSKNNNSNKFRGRRRTNYQMRLPGTSNRYNSNTKNRISSTEDDIHFKYSDVPWFDAELQERFSANHALTTSTNITKSSATMLSSSSSSSSSVAVAAVEAKLLPRLPSESVLQSIDDELHSFSVYVRLTHTERRAREHFLHHVAEQASSAALVLPSSNNNSMNGANYYNRNNVVGGSGGRGGGGNGGGGGRAAAARERIRVIPFGSFATQEVCCFASDVDMCLWGVVECEQTPSATTTATSVDCNRDNFIGNTHGAENDDYTREDDANNDDDGGGDVETDGDGCPLLTESSLLRTMDAIQSASASAAAVAAVAFDDGTSTEVSTSAATSGGKGTEERKQQQPQSDNINHEVDECLFFIDREGEAAGEGADSNDIESIHQSGFKDSILSTIHVEEHENTHELVAANDSASASSSVEGIHFEVDGKGMKELGGCSGGGDVEVIDLTASDDAVVDDGKVSDVKSKDQQAQREKAGDARRQTYTKEENGGLPERGEDSIIEIDDDSDDDSSEVVIANQCVNQDDGNDSDSADKMSSYYRRQDPTSEVQSGRMESQASPIALLDDDSSASSSSSADLDDDCSSSDSDYEPFHSSKIEVMELSLTSNIGHNGKVLSGNGGVQQHTKNVVMGPKGKARNQVVSALVSLTRQLRRSNFTHTIECRKGARVPIINCSTRTGFEGDIAIGGHNGVDTSMYAMSQVKRFRR
jgi:hypothetical protein